MSEPEFKPFQNLFSFASFYFSNGLNIIPLKPQSKQPAIKWKKYQVKRVTKEEIEYWFKNPSNEIGGIAGILGPISNNHVVLDLEKRELLPYLLEKLKAYPSLYSKVASTWIVRTGRGYHIHFKIDNLENIRQEEKQGEWELRVESGQTIVLPPSIHPKTGKEYIFVINDPTKTEIQKLTYKELKIILDILKEENKNQSSGERTLTAHEISEIIELIKPYYKPGSRDNIVFALSGWMRKAGISFKSAKEVIEKLAEETNDEEAKERIYVLRYQYGEKNIEIKKLTGKKKLLEIIFDQTGDREKSLEIIKKFQEIFGVPSPNYDVFFIRDKIFPSTYIIIDSSKKEVWRGEKIKRGESERFVLQFPIIGAIPREIIEYYDPLEGSGLKYKIKWVSNYGSWVVDNYTFDEIIADLKSRGGIVLNERSLRDTLNKIIRGFRIKNIIKVVKNSKVTGFFIIDGNLESIGDVVFESTKEDLKKALLLLSELREKWFAHLGPRFTTCIKWGIVAPFSYVFKQLNGEGKIPWLYLYGPSNTGKTTIGKIILSIWSNNPLVFQKSGGEVNTPAKLGKIVSETSLPLEVEDWTPPSEKNTEMLDTIKNVIWNLDARIGKGKSSFHEKFPARALLIITSQRSLPAEEGLIGKRVLVIPFSYSERLNPQRVEIYRQQVEPFLLNLRNLAFHIFEIIKEDLDKFKARNKPWYIIATEILRKLFKRCNLEPPPWIEELYVGQTLTDIEEEHKTIIHDFFVEKINNVFAKYKGRTSDITTLSGRLEICLKEECIPYLVLHEGREKSIYIKAGIVKEIEKQTGLTIGSLQNLAELMGWKLTVAKIGGKSIKIIKIPFEDFTDWLEEKIEETLEETEQSTSKQIIHGQICYLCRGFIEEGIEEDGKFFHKDCYEIFKQNQKPKDSTDGQISISQSDVEAIIRGDV